MGALLREINVTTGTVEVEADKQTKNDRGSTERERENKRNERGTLTRVCLYLRAFLSDASAAIDTLSLTQK